MGGSYQCGHIHIDETQREIKEWADRNFGQTVIKYHVASFLGMVEEVGEIAHSILKMSQGIRGTRAEHEEKIIDGIADLVIFTLHFAADNGIDAEAAVEQVWSKVRQRDWKNDRQGGGSMGYCRGCAKGRLIDPVNGLCHECRTGVAVEEGA
jgi:NTP pyrophosphatase (non-canonical NTP hydrolase)